MDEMKAMKEKGGQSLQGLIQEISGNQGNLIVVHHGSAMKRCTIAFLRTGDWYMAQGDHPLLCKFCKIRVSI